MRTILSLLAIIVFAAAFAVHPTAATAAPDGEVSTRIEVETETLGEGTLELDGDLEVGEVRDLWTDSGERVEITRTEEGYRFDVAGEQIDVQLGEGGSLVRIAGIGGADRTVAIAGGEEEDEVKVVAKTMVVRVGEDEDEDEEAGEGVVVSSGAIAGEGAEGKRIVTRVRVERPDGEGKAVVIGGSNEGEADDVHVVVRADAGSESGASETNLVLVKKIGGEGDGDDGEPIVIRIKRKVKKD